MQLNNEKTLEELRENRILEDETVLKLLETLKDDYKFFDDEDGYIYFCENKVIEEKKQLEKLLENQFFLDKKIILENNYCVYRLYKKHELIYDRDLKKEVENKNVAISVREYKMCSSKGESSKIYFENNYKSSPPLYYLRENGIYVAYQNKGYLLSSFKQISNQIEIKKMLYRILKIKFPDWVMWKELKEKHLREIFLSFEEIFNYKTKQELIEHMFNKKIKFNLNKLDIRIGISFVYYMDFIKEEDYQKLYEYTPKAGYSLRQIQGYSNREIVPEELIEKIKVQLKENNIKIKNSTNYY